MVNRINCELSNGLESVDTALNCQGFCAKFCFICDPGMPSMDVDVERKPIGWVTTRDMSLSILLMGPKVKVKI